MMDAGPAARECRFKLKCYWLEAAVIKTIVVLLNTLKTGNTVKSSIMYNFSIYTAAYQTLAAGKNCILLKKKKYQSS